MARFWTRKTEQAALLVAQDTQSDEAIAAACGVSKVSLEMWKRRPDFAARVQEHVAAFAEAIRGRGIAERQNRVDALNDRWQRMQRVIEDRAMEHDGEAPGAGTGLLVRQEKLLGTGRHAQRIVEWAVDTGLLNELRQHEKQAAQELGQWSEKREVTGKDGGPVQFEVTDARERLLAEVAERRARLQALPPAEGVSA